MAAPKRLTAHECQGPRHWEIEEVDLFAKLTSQLGFVLDQAALIKRQARGIAKSQLLNEIVDNMRRSLKEEDILNVTVSELRYALNTDRVIVYRFHNDWNGTIIAESVSAGWQKRLSSPFSFLHPSGRGSVARDSIAISISS
ncbi:MAG: hypothetical protein HC860_14840 [Alkalinema sp. RU_4_3]|nr:hypothetical protein [Alkalinema sp. RU_4_3]